MKTDGSPDKQSTIWLITESVNKAQGRSARQIFARAVGKRRALPMGEYRHA